MAKYLILYDTLSGEILRTMGNAPPENTLASGIGLVDGHIFSGIELGASPQREVEWIKLDHRWRFNIKEWNSESEAVLEQKPRKSLQEMEEVPYELMKEGKAVKFTNQQKGDLISEVQTEKNHTNVDALRVDVSKPILAREWKVNLSTKKLEKKEAEIRYE